MHPEASLGLTVLRDLELERALALWGKIRKGRVWGLYL
jgi:hypothetical protein